MNNQNLGFLLKDAAQAFPDKKAVLYRENGRYTGFSWPEIFQKVTQLASAFLRSGLKRGDRVAILSENRFEWLLVDMACQSLGLVSVPLYCTLTAAEVRYILKDSGARLVALSNKTQFEKLQAIESELPELGWVLGFDAALAVSAGELKKTFVFFPSLLKDPADEAAVEAQLKETQPGALASIIYTSGTTGFPKGVMLTHSNFLHNVIWSRKALKMGPEDLHLSFLPLSHVFERMAGHYLMMHIGATIAYAESLETVPQNLLEVRPTFILGVPRFYEKIKARVIESVEKSSPLRKGLFYWAKDVGRKKKRGVERWLAGLLVYKKFKKRLGGRVRFCISGGAPLPREIAEFFSDLGVMIYEGYGLTETSPVISVNREGKFRFGSVGVPLEEVQVRITEEGEIITKSECVMKGYHQKPEETAAVLKDGWFHTGDLGRIDRDGFLMITGRKKELIVTSGGKKVSPRPIEEEIEKELFVLRCILFGEGQRFLTALIVPNEERLLEHAKNQKIAFRDTAELLTNKDVIRLFEKIIEGRSTHLASYERIKYFALLGHDLSQESGELTPTLKVKREQVWAHHKDKLLPFYAE